MSRISLGFLSLLATVGAACPGGTDPAPVAFGGGSVVRSASGDCPADHPIAHAVGDAFLCLDASVDLTTASRPECAAAGVDCNTLYGCAAMALEQCDATETSADCGGDGPLVFACEDAFAGRCRWFTNGCVAAGFVPSPCPHGELCCDTSYSGTTLTSGSEFSLFVAAAFYADAFGREPVTLDDAFVLDVTEGEPSAWDGAAIVCPADQANLYVCDPSALPLNSGGTTGSWWIRTAHLGTNQFDVEVRTVASGETRARVCLVMVTDAIVGACTSPNPETLECASAGTVQIGTLGARAEVTLHGATWVLDFVP